MPRPLFQSPQQKTNSQMQQQTRTQGPVLNLRSNSQINQKEALKQQQMNKMQLDRLLRKTRSKEYMDIMKMLDAGGHVHNQYKVNAIINAIQKEFPEIELQGVLLGVVSKCYLGNPYEVHSLDMTGGIIEHYKIGETMPNGMDKARGIALCGSYQFVEVYSDCCRAVSSSGSVAVIK